MQKIDYKTYEKPSDFIKFNQGENRVRIISDGVFVKRHGMKTATHYIPLGNCTEDGNCEHCAKGLEPKQKWTWVIYSLDKKDVFVLDAGVQIGDQICQIAKDSGDPKAYDLIILRSGVQRNTKYTVKKTDPTKFDQELINLIKAKKAFLEKKYL